MSFTFDERAKREINYIAKVISDDLKALGYDGAAGDIQQTVHASYVELLTRATVRGYIGGITEQGIREAIAKDLGITEPSFRRARPSFSRI